MSEETVNLIIGTVAVVLLWAIVTYFSFYFYKQTDISDKI